MKMNRRNFRRKAARAGIRKPFSFAKTQVQRKLMACEKEYQRAKEEAPKLRLNHLRERLQNAEVSADMIAARSIKLLIAREACIT